MRVRFRTSIAGPAFSYMEGQTRDIPDPPPAMFRAWLRKGIVEPVRASTDTIAVPAQPERAVSLHRRGRRRATALAE